MYYDNTRKLQFVVEIVSRKLHFEIREGIIIDNHQYINVCGEDSIYYWKQLAILQWRSKDDAFQLVTSSEIIVE